MVSGWQPCLSEGSEGYLCPPKSSSDRRDATSTHKVDVSRAMAQGFGVAIESEGNKDNTAWASEALLKESIPLSFFLLKNLVIYVP